jgi:hypothetical protein
MEEKFPALWDTIEKNLFAILRLFSIVSHSGKNPPLLYPTMEENLLCCIPQQKKNSSVVSYNGKKPLLLHTTTAKECKT